MRVEGSSFDRVRRWANNAVDRVRGSLSRAADWARNYFSGDSFSHHGSDRKSDHVVASTEPQTSRRFVAEHTDRFGGTGPEQVMQPPSAPPKAQVWRAQLDLPPELGGIAGSQQGAQRVAQEATSSPAIAQQVAASAGAAAVGATPASQTTHTVKSGDTLSHIAARHGGSWQELARYNNLDNPHLIHPGDQIRIPPDWNTGGHTDGNDAAALAVRAGSASQASPTGPSRGAVSGDAVDRLIDYTAQNEGGGRYDAWNPNDNGAGVSFGLIQFNQQKGSLPGLLQRMNDANPEKFRNIFGADADRLTDENWVRNANLSTPEWRERFKAAGADPEFQGVQRQLAREQYFEPTNRYAEEYGLGSERARAMMFDTAVQYGVGGLGSKLRQARANAGPNASERETLAALADLADTHGYDANRRHRILNDPNLSDRPLGEVERPAGIGPANGAPSSAMSYRVRTGDSLSRIAGLHGTTVDELVRLNNIRNPNLIHPGEVLTLPAGAAEPATPPPQPSDGSTPGLAALNAASREVGVTEDLGHDEDRAGRIRDYRNSVTGAGYAHDRGPEPWCADFVSWSYKNAGKPLGPEGKGFAYCPWMQNWLQDTGQWHAKGSGYTPQPGDIVLFDWGGDGTEDHVGLVESVNADGSINTVEGNAPNGVRRRHRSLSTITGYGHVR